MDNVTARKIKDELAKVANASDPLEELKREVDKVLTPKYKVMALKTPHFQNLVRIGSLDREKPYHIESGLTLERAKEKVRELRNWKEQQSGVGFESWLYYIERDN